MEQLEQQGLLIDSSVIIAHLRQRRHGHLTAFKEAVQESENIYISTVSIYEIEMGALEAGRESDIEEFLEYLQVLDVTYEVAREAARIAIELKRKKVYIQNRDILIAGTARLYKLPILTDNLAHFKLVPGIHASNTVKALL